jgi:hypothetical protein
MLANKVVCGERVTGYMFRGPGEAAWGEMEEEGREGT